MLAQQQAPSSTCKCTKCMIHIYTKIYVYLDIFCIYVCRVSFDLVLIPDAVSLFNVFCSQASTESKATFHIRIRNTHIHILSKRINVTSTCCSVPIQQVLCFRMGFKRLSPTWFSIYNEWPFRWIKSERMQCKCVSKCLFTIHNCAHIYRNADGIGIRSAI